MIEAKKRVTSPGFYLSQSYQDAWNHYLRSLTGTSVPVWDYVILTASNAHQAEAFRIQMESRHAYLPERTEIGILPDEGGVRIGSGGATLSVLRWLADRGGWAGKKILVIHSGGDSRRVPQHSASGKLFSPVPHMLADGRASTLFDECMIAMSPVPGRFREGMVCMAGDVLLLFNPLLIDWNGRGVAAVSFKERVEIGKNHGVYLRGEDGSVKAFLHKQTTDALRHVGAVNDAGQVDIDTGMLLFGVDVLNALWNMVSTSGSLDELKYRAYVNNGVQLSLYGDFQYPLATDSSLDQFLLEKAEGADSSGLMACRKTLWTVLRPYRLKLLRLAPAKFIHFGTTKEIMEMMCSTVESYSELGWSSVTNASAAQPSYNSIVSPYAKVGNGIYAEVSCVHSSATVGEGSYLSYVDILDETIPANVVLHALKQLNGKIVCRIFGTDDNPKENRLFGCTIPLSFGTSLWNASLYPEKESMREAVASALALYDAVKHGRWEEVKPGKSLADGFNDADSHAILDWNKRMSMLVKLSRIQQRVEERLPARKGQLSSQLTQFQKDWLERQLGKSDYYHAVRLLYFIGTAQGGAEGEAHISSAFKMISKAILNASLQQPIENTEMRIKEEAVEILLPLRVNWGGGWSDTPPYCNENGGTVLNASILLNGRRPVSVRLKKLKTYKIVLNSADLVYHGEYTEIGELQRLDEAFDPFILQKAALMVCGVIPTEGGNLASILARLGGGFRMDTDVMGVPMGSGLGTSSILAAACVKAIFMFLGMPCDEAKLISLVLCIEQMASTGGGWQDQVGGLTDGIKYITSRPGLNQLLKVQHICLDADTFAELQNRYCLIFTGQRRLARNILHNVMGRYIGNAPEVIDALNEIQRIAALMRFELERGHVDAFAELLNRHWELSTVIDPDTTNTIINQIFDSIQNLIGGRMICGAGGGGFLQVVLKKGVDKQQLQQRIKEVFSDTEINVWDCMLV